ncbi:methyltransferase [Aneurinibacillus migulanus]|uniref:methyltransferase domain-containing protein n=1 Tax=Aneurinibacillus migulanus TaxID=47500 RepID=UPI0005B86969|nr:methyltransferase domain-containing protein [Aneurinibacillus migulanus]KIV53858.1 methyltransferase [Aneurinibacillus migulanus]KPD08208.1 methyltransferase [Aneurinibacillus migulanus]CEH30517.1 Uncharacterized protein BN1090_A2_02970 [Aneurinibacillus migulanus]
MAIIQIKSSNPDFSFIIKKNPASGMQLRSIRKGIAYGWYHGTDTYNIYFKDADTDISYKQHRDETFEYLNVSRYNTPLLPLNAIAEFLSATFKNKNEKDKDGYENSFFVNMIHIKYPRYIDFFNKHFTDFHIEIEQHIHKSYKMTIKSNRSIYKLVNFANVLFLFLAMLGKEYLGVSDSLVEKYLKSMNIIDAPYYIRYLFARNVLINKEIFYKFKKELEQTGKYAINFVFGNTAIQRKQFIEKGISFDKSILDIGCGEGFYALPFSGKIEDNFYYAIDINEELIREVDIKAKKRNIENLITFPSLHTYLESYSGEVVDVLLTEVIEHMDVPEAELLVKSVYENVKFDKFIITTPNYDFNQYYALNEFRHSDHKWEMNKNEFEKWIHDMFKETNYTLQFLNIGDSVDGVYTTQGVLITT